MSIVGYCRVSTKKQLKDGNGLEAQEKEILSKYENAIICKEQYTGKTKERPIFTKVLSELKENDILVVNKLDRLARNTMEGIDVIQDLFNRNVSVHALNVGLLENTTMGKFFITTLLAVAEMERSMIIERTQAGKEIAKQKDDYREGRPKVYTQSQLDWAISLIKEHGYRKSARLSNISVSTLSREVRKRKQVIVNG